MKKRMIHIIALTAVFIAVIGLIYMAFVKIMPGLIPALERGNAEEIESYLRSSNSFGGFVALALLQFLQVISIVIPGAPIQIAAGIVYGALKGFFLCHISYVISNLCVFLFARKFGFDIIGKENKKLAKVNAFINGRSPAYMTMLACLVPLMPNGVVPYAAANTRIRTRNFILAVYVGSFIPILVMCSIGGRILEGDFLFAVLIFAAFIILVVVLYRMRNTVLEILLKMIKKHNEKKLEKNRMLKNKE